MDDITPKLLAEIRDEIRGTNKRLDDLQAEIGKRFDHVDRRSEQIDQRFVNVETRIATELVTVAQTNRDILEMLREKLDFRDDHMELKRRVSVLEERLGA